MTTTTHVRSETADRQRGMTLGEVEEFTKAARAAGHSDDTSIYVRTGFRSQIQRLETK